MSVGASEDGVWMTKAELAAVRRISVASADRLIRRQRWRKQRGNDGRARVLVPADWAEPRKGEPTDKFSGNPTDAADRPTDAADRHPTDGPTDISHQIRALTVALDAIREAHVAELDRTLALRSASPPPRRL